MSDLFQRMVEEGARAMWQSISPPMDWDRAPTSTRERIEGHARACLTAALALAERDGAVLAVVPEERRASKNYVLPPYDRGHNACRAAFLAGKVAP